MAARMSQFTRSLLEDGLLYFFALTSTPLAGSRSYAYFANSDKCREYCSLLTRELGIAVSMCDAGYSVHVGALCAGATHAQRLAE